MSELAFRIPQSPEEAEERALALFNEMKELELDLGNTTDGTNRVGHRMKYVEWRKMRQGFKERHNEALAEYRRLQLWLKTNRGGGPKLQLQMQYLSLIHAAEAVVHLSKAKKDLPDAFDESLRQLEGSLTVLEEMNGRNYDLNLD